jgi:16S rRNA (cytosine967-C5)-methyltransferase
VSRAGSQARTLLAKLEGLRPHWAADMALPARIDALLSGDRRLGSRDRRLYRELIYTAVRYRPWVEPLLAADPQGAVRRIAWLAADVPAVTMFREEVTDGMPPCPEGADAKAALLGTDAGALTPPWFLAECPGAGDAPLRDSLLSRAPLWVRLQAADEAPVFHEFDSLGIAWKRSPLVDTAVELAAGSDLGRTQAYAGGKVEVQDIGSQFVLRSVAPVPGGRWLDACAGAGGKALQLAWILGPQGRVSARDVRRSALQELAIRAARSGLAQRIGIDAEPRPEGGYDGVLVDAPCSGTGTWRRSPHLRWATTPAAVSSAAVLQLRLLRENAAHVRAGGLLVYATCSLCTTENEGVARAFLASSGDFEPVLAGLRLLPQDHDGDGFFVASFRRRGQP